MNKDERDEKTTEKTVEREGPSSGSAGITSPGRHIENSLRESEEKMRSIFRAAPIGIGWVIDRVFKDVNHRFCEMTGYTREDLIGQSARMVYPSDEEFQNAGKEKYRQIAEQGTGAVETRFRRKDGQIIDVLLSSTPLDPADLSRGVTFTALDITERKRAEEALLESEDKFKYVFDHSAVGKSLTRPSGEIQVNRAFADMLGYSLEELNNKKWQQISYPDDNDLTQRVVDSLLSGQKDSARFRKRYFRKDGSVVWADVSTSLRRGRDGRPLYFMTAVIDITERVQGEEELRESEERFRSLYENATIGLYRTTPEGRIVMANPALTRMIGFESTDELLRRDLSQEGYAPEYPRREFQERLEREGEIRGLESAWKRKDGSVIFVRESARLVRDESGKPLYYEGTAEDITERKRAEKALQESERKLREAQAMGQLGNWEYDLASGAVSWSDQTYTLFGRNPVLGPPTAEEEAAYYSPEQNRILRDYSQRCAAEGNEFQYDLEAKLPGGGTPIFHATMRPIKDETGRVVKLFGTVQDITERKRAEMRLAQAAQEWQNTFDNMTDAVWILDWDLRVVRFNKKVGISFPRPGMDPVGKHCWEIVHGTAEPPLTCPLVRAQKSLSRETEEIQVGDVWLRDIVDPILDPDQRFAGAVHIIDDITERKKGEIQFKEQLDELQRWHAATLGREMRLIDLKREVNELLDRSGQPPRYPSAESEEA